MIDAALPIAFAANDVLPEMVTRSEQRQQTPSWLNLIAEMQGVPQVSLVRIQFCGFDSEVKSEQGEEVYIAFEVRSSAGQLLGSALWEGGRGQCKAGASIDIGYSLCNCIPRLEERDLTVQAKVVKGRNESSWNRLNLRDVRKMKLMVSLETSGWTHYGNDHRLLSALGAANQQF